MIERILIAGSGGQGVILIGRTLASMAIRHVPHVTFFPSYGAEVRGGTSACQIMLSSKQIASPLSEKFDAMIIMNQAGCDYFIKQISKDCLLVINTSLCKTPSNHPRTLTVDATRMADALGDTRVANFIMLGAYLSARPMLTPQQAETGIRKMLSGKKIALIDLNIKAFRAGLQT